ncbi:GATA transcription factor 5-like [Fagus crenata]
MDFCRNVSVSGEYQQEQVISPPCSKLGGLSTSLDDLFSAQNTEVDVSLEWLSVFVEDCLSSTGNCLPAPTNVVQTTHTNTSPKPSKPLQKPQQNQASLQNFVVPCKARSKRKRVTTPKANNPWSHHLNPQNQFTLINMTSSDPPLLQQAYWLADSELILPKKEERNIVRVKDGEQEETREEEGEEEKGTMNKDSLEGSNIEQHQMPRRCTHCLSQRTPQWRAGPLGPKTLCNACGVRYKSGRLLPEYRPAKSPTFVSYLHSNSHKKVMEMRNVSSTFHS